MPYFGAKIDLDRFFITFRIHGPLDKVPDGMLPELKKYIPIRIQIYDTANLPEICNMLAHDIKKRYLDGNHLVWVQVEITTNQDLIFGASAERVLVDTSG